MEVKAAGVSSAATTTAVETLGILRSNRQAGLGKAEAERRLEAQGPNEVPEERSHPALRFASKFWGLSAWMIELIALLSLLLHKRADLAITLALLVGNATLSFVQEQRASAAVIALRRKLQVTARALRDGAWQGVPARGLVTGDVVRVRAGDFVPVDIGGGARGRGRAAAPLRPGLPLRRAARRLASPHRRARHAGHQGPDADR